MNKELYEYMNTEVRKKSDFKKKLFKLMNNSVFGKIMESIRKHWDIKLVTIERRRNYLVSELNFHTMFLSKNLIAIKLKKIINIYE